MLRILAILAIGALSAPAASWAADSAPGPQGALIVHPLAELPEDAQRRSAMSTLVAAGAGRWEPHHLTLSSELLGTGWLSSAPTAACADPSVAPANFAKGVADATADLQFGRNDRAMERLSALVGALPCLSAPVTSTELYQLWFLTGAAHHLQGRVDDARQALLRAAVVDRDEPFDESFSPALRDLLVRAKEDVLARPTAQLVVLSEGDVRVNGHPVTTSDGRGDFPLRAGDNLVQVTRGTDTDTHLLRLSGLPLRDDVAVAAIVEPAPLARALSALQEDNLDAVAARRLVQLWLAEQKLPWALITLVGPGGGPAERRVLQISGLDGGVTTYQGRGTRGDAWTRRFRIGAYGGLRAQARAPGEPALTYGDVTLSGWASLAWLLRVGGTVSLAFAAAEDDSATVVVLPQVGFRLRLESPTGLVRPFGELGFLVEWPFAPQTLGGQEFGGFLSPVWGLEGWGGVMLVPGRERRIGIQAGIGGGASTQIGGFLRFRLGAEVRF